MAGEPSTRRELPSRASPWRFLAGGHGEAAKLLQDLNRAGSFDGLPTKLRERFVREVLEAMPWMRNNLGGHAHKEN